MSEDKRRVPGGTGDEAKAERLAAALRANLKRRKSQARAQAPTVPARDGKVAAPENPQKPGEKQG